MEPVPGIDIEPMTIKDAVGELELLELEGEILDGVIDNLHNERRDLDEEEEPGCPRLKAYARLDARLALVRKLIDERMHDISSLRVS